MRQILQSVWASPTSAVGLGIGACCLPFGARWRVHTGVLEISGGGVSWLLEHCTLLEGGAMAITFGEVVLARSGAAHDLTRRHERVHVRQARRWGPFFIPAYLLRQRLGMVARHRGVSWQHLRNRGLQNRTGLCRGNLAMCVQPWRYHQL